MTATPMIPFNFAVAFFQDGTPVPLCNGAFSEVSGLEATHEPKAIREGGRYGGEIQRAGQITHATVILKRGMTGGPDLWNWFRLMGEGNIAARLRVVVTLYGPEGAGGEPRLTWVLHRALPTKFRAATFAANAAEIGIEEIHLVHEGMDLEISGAPTAGEATA